MSASDTIPLRVEPAEIAGDENYQIYSRTEILSILKSLVENHALSAIFFNDNSQGILTAILEVDPASGSMIVDSSDNETANRELTNNHDLIFVSSLDNVKIQFPVDRIEKIWHDDKSAFSLEIPKQMMRLQRREYFRLATPANRPLVCTIPLSSERGAPKAKVNVLDISAGGVAVICFEDSVQLKLHETYKNCTIDLPGIGTVTVDMNIKGTFEIQTKDGGVKKRAGCEFIDMPGQMQTLIQRYIMKLERERRAKYNV